MLSVVVRIEVIKMTGLKDAIKIAERSAPGFIVDSVIDCGDRWAFYFKEFEGTLESLSVFVFKENGQCEFFFMTEENIEILQRGKRVNLPED